MLLQLSLDYRVADGVSRFPDFGHLGALGRLWMERRGRQTLANTIFTCLTAFVSVPHFPVNWAF